MIGLAGQLVAIAGVIVLIIFVIEMYTRLRDNREDRLYEQYLREFHREQQRRSSAFAQQFAAGWKLAEQQRAWEKATLREPITLWNPQTGEILHRIEVSQ